MASLAPLAENCTGTEFRLRSFALSDGPEITAALRQPAVATMLSSVPHPYPDDAAEDWIARRYADAPGDHLIRAVDVGGALAGVVALTPHAESGGLELGYWIAPAFWGQGLATSAARQLIAEALAADSAPGIFASAAVDNPASQRVLRKLGFEPVGTLKQPFLSRDAAVRCNLFWLDRRRPQLVLETRRLTLTATFAADIPRLVELLADSSIVHQTARMPFPYKRADAEAFIAGKVLTDRQSLAIRLKDEDGALIGGAGFGAQQAGGSEIGYWIGLAYWGRGYATEAARAVIDLVFSNEVVGELHATARVTNSASRRVLEKCGFQHAGTGLIHSRSLGGSVPVDRFRLDRGTWQSILAWRPAIRREPSSAADNTGLER